MTSGPLETSSSTWTGSCQLGAGPRGEPSRTDFQTHDLLLIIDRFATGWDDLPQLIPGRDDYRVLISAGVLVRALAVEAQLAPDGVIELVRLSIDTTTWT